MAVRVFEMDRQRINNAAYDGMISMPFIAKQSFSATSDGTGRSNAFHGDTRIIIVQADERVSIEVGSGSPTAGVNDLEVPAGGEKAIWVAPGHKIAARLL